MALPPPVFIEFICGPPGSGKTTYCEGKRQLLVAASPGMDAESNADRHLVHCNLDPANDGIFPYPCTIDICDLIELKTVAEQEHLGPNGSYLFCVDYISQHSDWLLDKVAKEAAKCASNDRSARRRVRPVWFTMDCPGQVEFYVHSSGLAQLVRDFTKKLKCHVCVTHLCDAAVATRDVFSYVSTCLLCLTSMTDIELPQLNVLSKWDRAAEQARELIPLLKRRRRERLLQQERNTDEQEDHVDDEEVAEYLECFTNASTFSADHFDQMWRDSQTSAEARSPQANQEAMARAMARRCGGGSGDTTNISMRHKNTKVFSSTLPESTHVNDDAGDMKVTESATLQQKQEHNLHSLSKTILSVVEGYNLVGFLPLDVQDGEMMQELMMEVDSAVGFAMHGLN